MDATHLNVNLVEAMQILVRKQKRITQLVANLRSATLAGIVEFGCMRFESPSAVPPLPPLLLRSPLCRALCEVRSDLGIRSDGARKSPVKNLSPRSVEFHVIESEADVDDVEWEGFCQRFESGAKRAGFSRDAAINLQSALFEMAANALIHSQMQVPALCGYEVSESAAVFTMADVGIGVLASLRSAPEYSYLTQPVDAIQLALQTGVTSRKGETGGFGFNSVFKALAEQWGQLRFRSGNGCITMDGTHLDADKSRRAFPPPLLGFQASICCRLGDSGPFQSML